MAAAEAWAVVGGSERHVGQVSLPLAIRRGGAARTRRGMADKAWAAGWNVVRLNQRNCGGTEGLSRGLYHSGLTADPLFVMRELIDADGLPAIAFAGYSLGGNVALKLAGDLGDQAPAQLCAVCAVSPTMDLAMCVRALERRSNLAYEFNFVRRLKARMRRKAALFPREFSLEELGRVWTVRQFDDGFTYVSGVDVRPGGSSFMVPVIPRSIS